MHYFFKSFVTKKDRNLYVFFDCYNKKLLVKADKDIIIEKKYPKYFFKDTIDFVIDSINYSLFINSFQFPLIKKIKINLLEDDKPFTINKIENKNWNIATKVRNYHVFCNFHSFNSSMLIKINDEVLYNSIAKEKFFEANIRKIAYDNQVFLFKKTKIEDETFTISLKFNSRDELFCQEDIEFKKQLAAFKKDNRSLKLKNYLKIKLLPIFIIPIILTLILLLQIFIIDGVIFSFKLFSVFSISGYLSFVLLMFVAYCVGFKIFKKRFS